MIILAVNLFIANTASNIILHVIYFLIELISFPRRFLFVNAAQSLCTRS